MCSSQRCEKMGATQSTRPKVLVYGAPHAGKKSLVKALGDAEFELFTTDDGADADAVVYVVDANQPTQWTVPIELLHSVNLKLGRTVPLCVVVNKSDVQGSAPAQQVLPQLAAAASKVDACAAVGGRVWRVVEASAVTGDIGVAALKRVLRHLCDMSDVSASILAPRSIGGVAGEACGASASLPSATCLCVCSFGAAAAARRWRCSEAYASTSCPIADCVCSRRPARGGEPDACA